MKKLLLAALVLVTYTSFAQSTATTVSYNKATRPALMLLLPYAPEIAEGAILQKMKEMGFNPESSSPLFGKKNTINGYYVFKNVSLKELNDKLVDLYIKVEQKGKKETPQSLVYMMMARGEEYLSAESDAKTYTVAQGFLNSVLEKSAAYKLDVDIQSQDETVKTAEKKYGRLQNDGAELAKKIKDLEEQLKSNKQQQENQLKVVNAERARLEELKKKKTK